MFVSISHLTTLSDGANNIWMQGSFKLRRPILAFCIYLFERQPNINVVYISVQYYKTHFIGQFTSDIVSDRLNKIHSVKLFIFLYDCILLSVSF